MDDEANAAANKEHDGERLVGQYPWTELVGLTGEEAKSKILEEKPGFSCHVLDQDCMVTADFRSDRVRIYVDSDGKVIRTPMVG